MIRTTVIVVLTIAASVTFAFDVMSFRKDYVTHYRDQRYGLNPGGFDVGKSCMLFVSAERGEFKVTGHHYILPARKVSRVSLDWRVVAFKRSIVTLPPETVERDRNRGRDATSKRLFWQATVQLWLLVVLFGAYPTTAFMRGPLRRRRRRRKGQCVNCEYNLTGNVTGKCSECGTKIEAGVGEGEYR